MRDTSSLLPYDRRLSQSREEVFRAVRRTFCGSPPQIRKTLRLRYGPVTSENGIPGESSTGGGTGPAPRRAARRQRADAVRQPRTGNRQRTARTDSGQGDKPAVEPAGPAAAADGAGPASSNATAAARSSTAGARKTRAASAAPAKAAPERAGAPAQPTVDTAPP